MGKAALVLIYLAIASHGRHVQTSAEHLHRSASGANDKLLKAVDVVPTKSSQSAARATQSSRTRSKALAGLLLAHEPGAAFNSLASGLLGKPTLASSHHGPCASLRSQPALACDGGEAAAVAAEELKELKELDELPDNLSSPEEDYGKLCRQVAEAIQSALNDGVTLIEVEFPPLPLSKIDDPSVSADELFTTNLELLMTMWRRFNKNRPDIVKMALTVPDMDERKLANRYFGDDEPYPGCRTWSLNSGDADGFNLGGIFGSTFKASGTKAVPADWAQLYIFCGITTQEMPGIRKLHEANPNVPMVFWNMKLDDRRGDLGLPAFPGQDLHHEFMCKIRSCFYVRYRAYTLTLKKAPFILAYQGVLFRKYPEPFQALLDKNVDNNLRLVTALKERPNLGGFKARITENLKLTDPTAREAAEEQADKSDESGLWWEKDEEKKDVARGWRL